MDTFVRLSTAMYCVKRSQTTTTPAVDIVREKKLNFPSTRRENVISCKYTVSQKSGPTFVRT